jgi:hypothetical protein
MKGFKKFQKMFDHVHNLYCTFLQVRGGGSHTLQQKVSLYVKWFHWIMSEFTSHNECDLVKWTRTNELHPHFVLVI